MPKILLIPDQPHWALDKCARDLVKYNPTDMQLDIVYADDFFKDWESYYHDYDLLNPMYMGLFFQFLKKKIPVDSAVTSIRSFHRWDHGKTQPPGFNVRPPQRIIRKLRSALLVNTHCQKLWYVFTPYFPIVHTKYTCDLEMFFPEPPEKKSSKLVVGWTGSLKNHGSKRGFYDFIQPVCEQFPEIELKVQAREDKLITDDNEMRAYYNSLDLYFCASRSEGTPRPVIEAGACGVPILTTDVGIVPELIDDDRNGYIVERTQEAMHRKLQQILTERDKLPEIGRALRAKMEREFNWNCLAQQWMDFYKLALELKKLRETGNIK